MIPALDEVALGAKLLGFGRKYWVYIVALIAVASLIAFAIHAHNKAKDALYNKGYAAGVADEKRAHEDAQANANAKAASINLNIRKDSDAKAGSINRTTGDVQLRGPGKAICPGSTPAPARASEPVSPPRPGNAAVAEVPDSGGQQFIALPFNDAVRFAGQCDLNRDEAARWRLSDEQQSAAAAASAQPSGATHAN